MLEVYLLLVMFWINPKLFVLFFLHLMKHRLTKQRKKTLLKEKENKLTLFVCELFGLITFFFVRLIDGDIVLDDFLLRVSSLLNVGNFLIKGGLSFVVVVVVIVIVDVVFVVVFYVVVTVDGFGIVKRSGG